MSKQVLSGIRGFFNFKQRTSSNGKAAKYGTFQQDPSGPLPSEPDVFETDVLEVWFAGCHSGA